MLKKLKNFFENTSGSILPIMGILTVPLTIAAAAAVDYTRYVNMRNEVQVGIDAAALATINQLPDILSAIPANLEGDDFNDRANADLKRYAESFLEANITSNISKESYTFNVNYSSGIANQDDFFEITASIEYDTIFGGINGKDGGILLFKDIISDQLSSIVNTGNRTIEVALVMDNSGSMGNSPSTGGSSKISSMRKAANKLVTDLHKSTLGSALDDAVKISLIPFSGTVNIDRSGSNNLDGDYIDKRGFNPVHHENFDWENTLQGDEVEIENNHIVKIDGVYQSRFDVFKMLRTDWGGCVEMRPWPHNVLDTYVADFGTYNAINGTEFRTRDNKIIPDTTDTGAKALFVPYFAPDEPDTNYYKDVRNGREPDSHRYRNSYLNDFWNLNGNRIYTDQNPNDISFGASLERQIDRTNWMFKYEVFKKFFGGNFNRFDRYGPNNGCTTQPITALTTDPNRIKNSINRMDADGFTNIQQGLTWGWRTLSESLPFDEGRPITELTNLKFIIMLTDGNNFYETDGDATPNNSAYGAWGYTRPDNHPLKHAVSGEPTHNRMIEGLEADDLVGTIYEGDADTFAAEPSNQTEFAAIMNAHTAQACENIKADGISIYTIAYDLNPDNARTQTEKENIIRTKALMEACSGPGLINGNPIIRNVAFYHDADGANLSQTFANITSSISAIRLTK